MMHLMVNCRHMLAKKTTSCSETLKEGLATFASDTEKSDLYVPQQILVNAPEQGCQCHEPDVVSSSKTCGDDFEHVAYSASGDGDGSDRCPRKGPLGRNRGHRRSAPLGALQMDTIFLGPTLTSSLPFKEHLIASPVRAKLTTDDSTGKFAYISLDGRLVNASLATRDEEARAWEDFAPMQLVLIVAVTAAVSAAAKHKKMSEIDRLLKSVENRVLRNRWHCLSRILDAVASFVNIIVSSLHTFFWALVKALGISSLWTLKWTVVKGRLKLLPYMTCSQEKELISLRQELNEICKLNGSNASHLCIDHLEPFPCSPETPTTQKKLGRSFNGKDVVGNSDREEGWSSRKSVAKSVAEDSLDLFSNTTSPGYDEVRAQEESKWYVNPMVESSPDSDDSYTTPERCSPPFSACNPAVQGSFEWKVSRSPRRDGDADVSAGLPPLSHLLNEPQVTSDCNNISKFEENIEAWRRYLQRDHGSEADFEGGEKSPNKLKLSDQEDLTDLAKQLQSRQAEIADLKECQKVLQEAKNREIEALKEVLKIRDAELERLLVVAETSKTANADRLAILEELCRDKDCTIFDLKQDIQSLEWKVQNSRVYQSPTALRDRRNSTSFLPSSGSHGGTSQKQRLTDKYDSASDPGSNHIIDQRGRLKRGSNGDHVKTQRHENDGKSELGYDQETSLDYSFLLGSSVRGDCSGNSLVFSESDIDRGLGSGNCVSLDDSRSKDHFSGINCSSDSWKLRKQNSMSSDSRRATSSFATSARSFTRTQSSRTHTSADESTFKLLRRNLSDEMKKVIKNPNSPWSSPGSSPQTRNLKGLRSVFVQHFRSSSLDTKFKTSETSGGVGHSGSSNHLKNSTTKRKQWV